MNANYLAFDLGAESGRAILGTLRSGLLDLREVRRFPNRPLQDGAALRWDVPSLWQEMQSALADSLPPLAGVGVDTWGVDYALIGRDGALLENPYHYRDGRTAGVMEHVCREVPRDRIYSITGVQFLPFNTLYQLYAACRATPGLIDAAQAMLTIPDLFNYRLTGALSCEYTNATTTQLVDVRTRGWSTELIEELGLPGRLFVPLSQPGSIAGRLASGVPVIAPACHDTGSAVAAISMSPDSAFLSSGTWSLLGAELSGPVVTPLARDLNFTNEGGVCGTVRLLKNIAGLWLLESCRRSWSASGREFSHGDLLAAAGDRDAFRCLINPDDPAFLHPEDMPAAIAGYCAKTAQPAPDDAPGYARAILESLAFRYRATLDSLERITQTRFTEIRIVGGGSRNRLLNQFAADATGRTVVAGPAEATALGNIAMQMLATGAVSSLSGARAVIERSFPTERFKPASTDQWDRHYARFQSYG